MADLRLYSYYPEGHGPVSMHVVAENETFARELVEEHMSRQKIKDPVCFNYNYQEGDLSKYRLAVTKAYEVMETENR